MAKRAHIITLPSGTQIGTHIEDVYGANGSTIDEVVGVRPTSDDDLPEAQIPAKVLQSSGAAIRLRIFYTEGNKKKSALIYCATDKIASALNNLPTKQYKGNEITSATVPGQFDAR
jgi:hypothetical protein